MKRKDAECRLRDFFAALQADLSPERQSASRAAARLAARARKRAELAVPGLRRKAEDDFLALNLSLRGYKHEIPSDVLSLARSFVRHALERFTRSLDRDLIQGTLKWSYLLDNWRFGPGASHEVTGTHAVDKIEADFTCTRNCEPLVRILRTSNPYFRHFDVARGSDGVKVLQGSKLATVPKNEDTERTIATEPLGNMMLQLAAGRYLENALASIGLDIRDQQPRNKALAQIGSLDGSVATLDLKSASDRISLDLVRALFPAPWISLLEQLRSPKIKVRGEWTELHMISTMGNGFTFPMMTLIITSLVYANRATLSGSANNYVDWSRTAVFGDDIIVPTEEFATLTVLLEQAGFIVNHDKSFGSGSFRESCGGDYWDGVDITPFYIRSLDTEASLYIAINSVLRWSSHHGMLSRSLEFLLACLGKEPLLVPEYENPDAGIRTSGCPKRYKKLAPKVKRVEHRPKRHAELFTLPLMAGGYISSFGKDLCFTPRIKRPRYGVRKSRLPKGYLDGRCALSFTAVESRDIGFFLNLVL